MQLVKICFAKLAKLKSFIAASAGKQQKIDRQACRNGNIQALMLRPCKCRKRKGRKLLWNLLMNIISLGAGTSHTALHRSHQYAIGEMAAQTRNLCGGYRSIANPTVL
jgi:hypothetical protein